nr:DUF4942 domain-containing protein [Acidovorax carolinensis]
MFRNHFEELKQKKRLSSAYFDVRYHSGVGTIHFFPTRPDLIDRLNRLVGQHRKWLPENMAEASEDFLKQYTSAEKFDAEIRKEFASQAGETSYSRYYNFGIKCLVNPTANTREMDEHYKQAVACMDRATTVVLERKGINVQALLTSASSGCAHAARSQLAAQCFLCTLPHGVAKRRLHLIGRLCPKDMAIGVSRIGPGSLAPQAHQSARPSTQWLVQGRALPLRVACTDDIPNSQSRTNKAELEGA